MRPEPEMVLQALLTWDDPCVRSRTLVEGRGLSPDSPEAAAQRDAILTALRSGYEQLLTVDYI